MSTRLIFIRHAQSTWNEAGRWQGHANPPLTENGRKQAELLARRLSNWGVNHLYASDLNRAATTAAIIAERLSITPVIDAIWRERGIGAMEGLTTEEVISRFPDAWASRLNGPMDSIPGAEPSEAVLRRAAVGCDGLLSRHSGETVIVVSHGGMIVATLVHLLGLPPVGFARLVGGRHTAISQVIVEDGHALLTGLNDTAHLELLIE